MWWASVVSISVRIRSISSAWISRSENWPWITPDSAGWWISTRAFGSASRLPGLPAASSTAAADAAWPRHTVWMSARTYCMVS